MKMTLSAVLACTIGLAAALPQNNVPAYSQTLAGTWISQVADASGNIQLFEIGTFHPDGSYSGANVNGSHTEHKGVWLRIGDRRFVLTVIFFTHDEKLALTGVVKAKIYITMSEDLKVYESVAERTMIDVSGKVMSVTPEIRGRSVRMDVEFPVGPAPE